MFFSRLMPAILDGTYISGSRVSIIGTLMDACI